MARIGSLGHGVRIFGYPCEKETRFPTPHRTEVISMCSKRLYDSGEGNDFLKQDIKTKSHKEKN